MSKTKPNLSSSYHQPAVLRSQYRMRLAWQWIKVKREDISDIIEAEAAKRYPYTRSDKVTTALPDVLNKSRG